MVVLVYKRLNISVASDVELTDGYDLIPFTDSSPAPLLNEEQRVLPRMDWRSLNLGGWHIAVHSFLPKMLVYSRLGGARIELANQRELLK